MSSHFVFQACGVSPRGRAPGVSFNRLSALLHQALLLLLLLALGCQPSDDEATSTDDATSQADANADTEVMFDVLDAQLPPDIDEAGGEVADANADGDSSILPTPCDPTTEWCPYGSWGRQHDHDYTLWSPQPGVVWVATFRGWVTRYSGQGAEVMRVSSGPSTGVTGLWGAAEDDVWLVGLGSQIEHWNGTAWETDAPGISQIPAETPFYALSGSSADNVWALAHNGVIAHWNGVEWSHEIVEFDGVLLDVLAASDGDVWVTGEICCAMTVGHLPAARIWRRHEGVWIEMELPIDPSIAGGLSTVVEGADGEIWFGGPSDFVGLPQNIIPILRFRNQAMETVAPVDDEEQSWRVTSDDAGNIWVSGTTSIKHWNGAGWDALPNDLQLRFGRTVADGEGGLWALVENYGVARWNGLSWSVPFVAAPTFRAVTSNEQGQLWAVGDLGVIATFENGQWGMENSSSSIDLHSVWAGSEDVWAVGLAGTVLHRSAAGWEVMVAPTNATLWGVWASGPDDVWVVGGELDPGYGNSYEPNPSVFHWNGTTWSADAPPATEALRAVAGVAGGAVFVAGEEGALWRWDAGEWSTVQEAPDGYNWASFRSLFVDSAGILWAGGSTSTTMEWSGFMARWEGDTVTQWNTLRTNTVDGIWSDGQGRAFAAGQGMEIYTLENNDWTLFEVEDSICMHGVVGQHDGTVWVTGDDGWIYHRKFAQ